ncbi:MAG: hypothetical protein WCG03_01430 [Kiritimatiellales bacterium]
MKNKWIITLVLVALCGLAQASLEVNVDLGTYDQTGLSGNWNTVGNSATNLIDWNTGSQTALGIVCANWSGTAGTDGWQAGQNVGWVNAIAANDYLFMYQDMMGEKTGKITLYGLTDGQEYRLQVVSSESYWSTASADIKAGGNWASADYQGKYSTNIGDNWDPRTAYTDKNWLIWDSVYSSGGSLEVTVTTTSGMNATAVNALRIEAIPEPASALLIGCGGLLIAGYRRFYGRS